MANTISNDIKVFLEKKSTQSFLKAAQNFVSLLEDEELLLQNFIIRAHSALVELYVAGHNFEEIEIKDSKENKDVNVNVNLSTKYQHLLSQLDKDGFYWEVFDPTYLENESKPVAGWLVDDFSDIYRDLKTALEKIELNTNEAIEDALWELKFSFRTHWGNHCIDALRALHYLWYKGKR